MLTSYGFAEPSTLGGRPAIFPSFRDEHGGKVAGVPDVSTAV
jgi:hypothetical protein